jgi:type VI secretion system protein ImpH
MGMGSLRHRDEIGDVPKMYYAGRLACYARNAEGLQAILQDYFDVPAQIEQFVGQWLELPDDCRCRLGESPGTGKLGLTTIVGRRTWECQLKFRIIIGPVTLAAYRRFLPGQESLRRLAAWVRRYVGEGLDWDVQLVLAAGEVPGTVLGGEGMLGWTTWLVSGRMKRDARDLVLSSASRGIGGTQDNE